MRTRKQWGAFTLTDLAATIAASLVLLAILGLGLGETRRAGQLGESIANLKRYAVATTSYAADNDGYIWGLSWQGGTTQLMADEDGNLVETVLPEEDVAAQGYQAVHLIRTLGDRVGEHAMPLIESNWIANIYYSHLPLAAYLDADPLDRWTADPGDRDRQNWKDDPINKFDQGLWWPDQPNSTPLNWRWPYSTSYTPTFGAFDVNQSLLTDAVALLRTAQGTAHNFYYSPEGHQYFGPRLSDVAYPGNKVHIHDTYQRHFGAVHPYFGAEYDGAEPFARVTMTFFDASAGVRSAADANEGWKPWDPAQPCHVFNYEPSGWEEPTISGTGQDLSHSLYRETRGGLKGIDFAGAPLDTGQMIKCPF